MDCRDCEHLKRFQRMSGGKPYCICDHEEQRNCRWNYSGSTGRGLSAWRTKTGNQGSSPIPDGAHCAQVRRKGQYVAEWGGDT